MADNKSQTSGRDRKRVAAEQAYEVSYFARKHGLSTKQARTLIQEVGNDRKKLDAEAKKLAASTPSERRTRRGNGQASNQPESAPQRRKASTGRSGVLAKVAAVGGAIAAGALLMLRRRKFGGKPSDEIVIWSRESEADPDGAVEGNNGRTNSTASGSRRSQAEISEEALTLKETGQIRPGG